MLYTFISTVYHVFLPISLPIVIGALLRRFQKLETEPLSTLSLYMLTPALLFETLLKAEISVEDISATLIFSLLHLLAMWGLASGVGTLLKLPSSNRAGLTLVSTFTNSVNYGLPLVLLAFGQTGLDRASVFVIGQIIIVNTIGVYFAARSHFSIKQAVQSIFTLPAIYAALFAIVLRTQDMKLPEALDNGISMISDAYAPVVLTILGAQMMNAFGSAANTSGISTRTVWTGILARMLLSPVIAWAILLALQVKGDLFGVLLILASMPAAVNAVILAERFDASPRIVSRCILWTTLASFLLLPVLIVIIQL